MSQVIAIDTAMRALAFASTAGEVVEIAAKAEGLRKHAQTARRGMDEQNKWAEVRLRAERRLGEMLRGRVSRGRPKIVEGRDIFRLGKIGISRDLSSRAQRVAAVMPAIFERYFRHAKEHGWEITTADFFYRVEREAAEEFEKQRAGMVQQGRNRPTVSLIPGKASIASVPTCQLRNGDCLELMRDIPDRSIDLILTDLPYGATRCSWDTPLDLKRLWKQFKRIVKPYHAIVLTATQPFASILVMSNLDWFKYEWIWHKTKPTNFVHAPNKPMRAHENILVFSEGTTIQASRSMKRMPYYPHSPHPAGRESGRYPTSIIRFPADRLRLHPAAKPIALMRYLVESYTQAGDVVLDCCMGSGSTGAAALDARRSFIGIEIDDHYFRVAADRLKPLVGSAAD
jgi:site-specific DNA-methyltransferase (adenine-specific)